MQIDTLDIKIISELSHSKNFTYSELSKKLYVSLGTIHQRIKKLEKKGIIKSLSVEIDYQKLGYEVTSFLGIYLEKSSLYDKVVEKLKKITGVLNAYYTTGRYSIFVTIMCKNMQELRNILHDEIQTIPGITRTETIISLEKSFEQKPSL